MYMVCIHICRTKSTALGAYILPEGREAISGSRFMIFRTKPAMRFMNASNWRKASGLRELMAASREKIGRSYPSNAYSNG